MLAALSGRFPVRLIMGELQFLLPYLEGGSWHAWRRETRPALGGLRASCLAVLQQVLEQRVPPCLLVLMTMDGNLVVDGDKVRLQYFVDLERWEAGKTARDACCALARLFHQMLTDGDGAQMRRRYPFELLLLRARAQTDGYCTAAELQRDLAALPDELPSYRPLRRWLARLQNAYSARVARIAVRVGLVLLAIFAVLCIYAACRRVSLQKKAAWPGLPRIGTQEMSTSEEETP